VLEVKLPVVILGRLPAQTSSLRGRASGAKAGAEAIDHGFRNIETASYGISMGYLRISLSSDYMGINGI